MAKRKLGAFHPEYGWAGDIQKAGALTRDGVMEFARSVRAMRQAKPSCKVAKRHWERGADKIGYSTAVDPDNSDQAACFSTGKTRIANDFEHYTNARGPIARFDKGAKRLCVYDTEALQAQVLDELVSTCGPVRTEHKSESFNDFQSKDVYRARNARRRKRRS